MNIKLFKDQTTICSSLIINKIENNLKKGLQKCFEEIVAGEIVVEYALKNYGGQIMAKIKCPFCQVFLAVSTNKKKDKTFRSFDIPYNASLEKIF